MTILKNKIVQNIFLILFSLFLSIYLVEGILTVINSSLMNEDLNLKRIKQAEKLGIPFDTRSHRTVVNDLRSQGVDAYFILPPFYLLKDNPDRNLLPLGTISQKLMVMHNETGKFESFISDEHGFHNPQGAWSEKKTDILIVGDSFAMGANVRSGADIRSQLANHGKKVITVGINGNGPLFTLASLIEYGKYLKPKIILWLYYELNDLEDLLRNRRNPILMNYMDDNFSQNLLNRQNQVDQEYNKLFRKLWEHKPTFLNKIKGNLFDFITLDQLRDRLSYLGRSEKSQLILFKSILEKAKNVSASWGGKLIFVNLPAFYRYFYQKDDQYMLRTQVLGTVKELDIPIIDFHQAIKKQEDPLDLFPFRVHGHYTEVGYALLASTIMSELQQIIASEHPDN
jgi:hypothetical protein